MDIGFALNYTHIYLIDTTPDGAARTWARIGAGIQTVEPDPGENIDQADYYDGDGMASSEVMGGQLVLTFTGHRVMGDVAQDYISGLSFSYGQARKTHLLVINPDGSQIDAAVTIANITGMTTSGGDANAKNDISFELHVNGLPAFTEPEATQLPESVTPVQDEVTVAVGGSVTVAATVTPATASDWMVYASSDTAIAKVDANGNVTGVSAGECTVSIKAAAKPSVSAPVNVTVTA